MNVDRRWWATSVLRVRVLAVLLVVLGAGCAVLGWGSHLRHSAAQAKTAPTFFESRNATSDTIFAAPGAQNDGDAAKQGQSFFADMPLFFEPNQGQGNLDPADARAKFVNRGSGYNLFLGSEGAILSLSSADHSPKNLSHAVETLQMKLAGVRSEMRISSVDPLPGKSNYFIGNDRAKWRTGVPHFARVRYDNVYPGIDLVFYGKQGRLEYDFQVAPDADPAQAELEFTGAKKLELKDGALIVAGGHGSVRLDAPRVYQTIAGNRLPIQGNFVLRGPNRVGFSVGAYDHSRELIIDPVLNFSTYFGGTGDDRSTSVAVDGSLNVYLTGSTTSANLPVTTCPYPACGTLSGAQNAYVAKIQPPLGSNPAALMNVTYLGGTGTETPVGIKVDGAGNVFVAGTTSSADFPTTATNAYQSKILAGSTGTAHVFVSKIKNDFTELNYSSYLSGNGTDTASGMTIDAAGNVYVTGTTSSNNVANASAGVQFPASIAPAQYTAFQPISNAALQFFVTKVNTSASGYGSISYSTYFGGANFNPPSGITGPTVIGGGIAVDSNGIIYFSGTTNFTYTGCSGCASTDFPILNAYQPCLDQPQTTVPVNPPSCTPTSTTTPSDAFVAKLNPTASVGQQLIWSTYVGGTGDDFGVGVALDPGATNVYLVGTTDSTDIGKSYTLSTSAAYQACLDQPGVAVGACTPPSTPPNDAFVARLSNPTPTGTNTSSFVTLNYFSYLGGSAADAGVAITVDTNSGAMVTGWTQSADFPVYPAANPIQSSLNGPQDAFVARINTAAVVGQNTTASWANYFGGTGTESGTGIALDVNQNTYLAGESNSADLQMAKAVQATNAGGYDAFVTQFGTAVSLSIQGVLTLGTNQTFISAGNPATFTYTVTNNGPDLASGVTITANMDPAITGVPLTNITASVTSGTCGAGTSSNTSVSCGPVSLQSGSTATMTVTATPTANSNGNSPEFFNGGTVQALAPGNILLAQTSVSAEMSDFSMSVSPSNQNVPQAGASATYQVQLTPHPLYNSNITLSCSGAPSGGSCQFSPSSVALQGASGGTSTLTLTTTARPVTTAASSFTRRFYAVWLVIPGLAFAGLGRRRRLVGISMFCVIFALLLFLPACSHGTSQTPPSGTPAGSYPITVTATSGTNSKSQTVTLSVP